MYKAFISYLLLAIALISCSDKEEVNKELQSISIDKTDHFISSKGMTTIKLRVTPIDAQFNYNVNSHECQVTIQNGDSRDSDNLVNITLYDITKDEKEVGLYHVTIKDIGKNNNYKESAIITIKSKIDGIESKLIKSTPFNIICSGTSFSNVTILKEKNPTAVYQNIEITSQNNTLSVSSPLISSPNLILSFSTDGEKVFVGNLEQVSGETKNDFSKPVVYRVVSASGDEKSYTVSINYSGLPVLIINTPNNKTIPSKFEDWLAGTELKLYNPDWSESYVGTTSIRGRGNSTWTYPKKPYALKLDSKAKILGMPAHKRWVLLANWMDRTILRNRVAFEVAMKTGLAWTPRGEFVDVILNGKHIGNYYLCEQIKVDKNRVNINELEDDVVDGGYIFELDTYFDEVNKFKSTYFNLPYMFKDPDEVNSAQFDFIKNYVNTFEESLKDNSKFQNREYINYIDETSFIDWWLVHELTGNSEPGHPKSSYMHKDKGGKLIMGPVWDFDWATFVPHSYFIDIDNIYYGRLFQDPQFKAKAKQRWNELKPKFKTIPDFITVEADRIKCSEKMNHELWPINVTVNQDVYLSFKDAVNRMKSAYNQKLVWMDNTINAW